MMQPLHIHARHDARSTTTRAPFRRATTLSLVLAAAALCPLLSTTSFSSPLVAQAAPVTGPRAPLEWTVPANAYYPGAGNDWQRRSARVAGFDSTKLAQAVAFAIESENSTPRDLELAHYQSFGREPFGDAIGEFAPRGDAAGMIVRGGYIVSEWGDVDRVDMTFSVSKSFLSTTVGLAVDRGLIHDVNDVVAPYVPFVVSQHPVRGGLGADRPANGNMLHPFTGPHNSRIRWDDLLRQTSDWDGVLWGKPEWADRPDRETANWLGRARKDPGTAYEYNDTRVNLLALATTNVWRRPLPEVLREHIMDPIGASSTWRWMGYHTSFILLDGRAVEVVSGGGHWGGGMFISARDQARFGLLTLRRGKWKDKQLLSDAWVKQATTPTVPQPTYGYMNWFLNTDGRYLASATPKTFAHVGNGTNIIIAIPEHDLLIVARWISNGAVDGLVQRVLAALD